ncbi:MAG: sulfite exporter TauE/SafE family protein [Pseudomonadales bacterium]|nr:sulfite exporter TauE/SafE family protein [Pseudomonadales bacterium]
MDFVLATGLVFIGAFVQTAVGFGLAVIAAPMLFFIDPAYVPAPVTVSALVLSVFNAASFRQGISLRGLKFAIIGRVPGSVAGVFLLLWIDQDMLALWIGLSVLLAVAVSLSSLRWDPTSGRMLVAGFLSGFMGSSTSIGGPPMALLWQHQQLDAIRANLAAFFVISCLISLAMLMPAGYFGTTHLRLSLNLLPGTIAGYLLARKTMHLLPHRQIRLWSLALCAFSGAGAVLSVLL